jgi:hypothetical protein
MDNLEGWIICGLLAAGYVTLGLLALRNPGPDPEECPRDCPVCRGEYETTEEGK